MTRVTSDIGNSPDHILSRAINMQAYIDDGYVYRQGGLDFTDLPGFLRAVKGKVHDYRDYNRQLIVVLDKVVVFRSGCCGFSLLARSEADTQQFLRDYSEYLRIYDDDSVSISYYHIVKGTEVSSDWMQLRVKDLPTVIPELYPGIDSVELARAFKAADEPILLLYGIPGVGKTTYLKYLLQTRQYKSVAYIKDMQVMMASAFWSRIASSHYDLLIFDDLDFALGPRSEGDHAGFVSNLLSYSDGIFNHNRSKIVITTNQPINRIDNALVRPGRCFDFLVLEPLSFSEGREVWVDVLKMEAADFDRLYNGQPEITQASIMSDYQRLKIATMERKYIKGADRFYTVEQKLGQTGVSVFDTNRPTGFERQVVRNG